MSQKSMRRMRRRTDDETDQDFKAPVTKKEYQNKMESSSPDLNNKQDTNNKEETNGKDVNDKEQEIINNKNGVNDEAGNLKGFVNEEETNNTADGNESNSRPNTRSRSNTPQSKKDAKSNGDANEEKSDKSDSQNNGDKLSNNDLSSDDMEPLVVDVEEDEPELEFDENSEAESHKDSPNSTRCKTRRSQTRNIPTPKTPKSFILEVEEPIVETPAAISVEPDSLTTEVVIPPENSSSQSEKIKTDDESNTNTQDSLENLSTKVQVPSDETRNIEITISDEQAIDQYSFLNLAKEKSFTEILRRKSSRRPIHSIHKHWDNADGISFNRTGNLSLRPSVEKISGVKRKNRSETPESKKRTKTESTNNGFFSYISSPIANIKNRFLHTKSEVPSSTPKLTGYKDKIFENPNVSKIDGDINNDTPPTENKWCSIM